MTTNEPQRTQKIPNIVEPTYRIIEVWREGQSLSLLTLPLPTPPTAQYLSCFTQVGRFTYEDELVWVAVKGMVLTERELASCADHYMNGAKIWKMYELSKFD